MPTVLRKYGFRFHFFSADGHEPQHIHVDADGKRAKIWLHEVAVARIGGFNEDQMKRIIAVVKEHREEMLEAWHEYFG
jgi:hypothetical protein